MDETYKYLYLEGLTIPYINISEGEKKLLAFHGFGRTAFDFLYFKDIFYNKYIAVGVNHFHHEDAEYPDTRLPNDPLQKEELADIYMKIPGIKDADKITILAYSMGGKSALLLLELYPEKIDKVILMAPDGLYISPWYKFVVNTFIGRGIFRFTIQRPQFFFKAASVGNKIGMLNDKQSTFFTDHMATEEIRRQVYNTWMTYKKIIPDMKVVLNNIIEHNIETHLLFGKYDSIITPQIGKNFANKSDLIHLHVLSCGHMMYNKETNELLNKLI